MADMRTPETILSGKRNPSHNKFHSVLWRIMIRQFPLVLIFIIAVLFWLEHHLRTALNTTSKELTERSSQVILTAIYAEMKLADSTHLWAQLKNRIHTSEDT